MKELEKFRCPCCNQKDTVVPNTIYSVCIVPISTNMLNNWS